MTGVEVTLKHEVATVRRPAREFVVERVGGERPHPSPIGVMRKISKSPSGLVAVTRCS
jgi:hypothetical protein